MNPAVCRLPKTKKRTQSSPPPSPTRPDLCGLRRQEQLSVDLDTTVEWCMVTCVNVRFTSTATTTWTKGCRSAFIACLPKVRNTCMHVMVLNSHLIHFYHSRSRCSWRARNCIGRKERSLRPAATDGDPMHKGRWRARIAVNAYTVLFEATTIINSVDC